MENILKEISARRNTYNDEKARADVNTLLNLLANLGEKYEGKRRPITAPGIELRYKENRWQTVLNFGDWLHKNDEDFNGEIFSHFTSIEQAIVIAIELQKELCIIIPHENRKPLLFHDNSVPKKMQERFETCAIKFGFRTK